MSEFIVITTDGDLFDADTVEIALGRTTLKHYVTGKNGNKIPLVYKRLSLSDVTCISRTRSKDMRERLVKDLTTSGFEGHIKNKAKGKTK